MTGVIKTGLEKYVDKIPGTASINELQKLLFGEQLTSSERFCQSSELFQGSYKKFQPFFKDFSRPFQGPH